MKDKIRKAADKSKSYSQFAEAEDPKRCRNTKRHVQKRTSVRSWKWRIKHSVPSSGRRTWKNSDVRIDCRSICGPKTAKYTLIAGLRGALFDPCDTTYRPRNRAPAPRDSDRSGKARPAACR